MTLKLLQQLAVHIIDIKSPHSYQRVVAPGHHQVLGCGVVLSTVHKGWMREHLLGRSQKPLHIPLSGGEEQEKLNNANTLLCKESVSLNNTLESDSHHLSPKHAVSLVTKRHSEPLTTRSTYSP